MTVGIAARLVGVPTRPIFLLSDERENVAWVSGSIHHFKYPCVVLTVVKVLGGGDWQI